MSRIKAAGRRVYMMEMLGDEARAELAGDLGLVTVHCRCGCVRGEAVRDSGDEPGKELKG